MFTRWRTRLLYLDFATTTTFYMSRVVTLQSASRIDCSSEFLPFKVGFYRHTSLHAVWVEIILKSSKRSRNCLLWLAHFKNLFPLFLSSLPSPSFPFPLPISVFSFFLLLARWSVQDAFKELWLWAWALPWGSWSHIGTTSEPSDLLFLPRLYFISNATFESWLVFSLWILYLSFFGVFQIFLTVRYHMKYLLHAYPSTHGQIYTHILIKQIKSSLNNT